MPTLTILATGEHLDQNGQAIEITPEVLDGLAANYNPQTHEAPLVLGHPKHNAPAFGWIRSLRRQGNLLTAELDQLHDKVAEWIDKGAYKKLSASLYQPNSPANPAPGQYSLRHIGLLGAEPPAIKGLPAIQFAEVSETIIERSPERTPLQKLLAWVDKKFGREAAETARTELDLADALPPAPPPSPPVCLTELAPSPSGAPEVADLIEQAHQRVARARASGRPLNFAEAVTTVQQENQ